MLAELGLELTKYSVSLDRLPETHAVLRVHIQVDDVGRQEISSAGITSYLYHRQVSVHDLARRCGAVKAHWNTIKQGAVPCLARVQRILLPIASNFFLQLSNAPLQPGELVDELLSSLESVSHLVFPFWADASLTYGLVHHAKEVVRRPEE